MRRPLIGFFFAEAFGILMAHYELIRFQHLCMICAGVFLLLRFKTKSLIPLMLIVFLSLGFFRMDCEGRTVSDLAAWDGQVVRLSGVITKVEVKEYYLALTLAVDQGGPIGETSLNIREKTLLQLELQPGEYPVDYPYRLAGKRAECSGRISCPEGRRNPGGFDYRLYLQGKGIHTLFRASRYRFDALETEKHLLHGLSIKKGEFLKLAGERMSPEGFSLLAGLLFGEKNYIQEDVYEGFRQSGMGHIFAVSGLHVGLLYAVLLKISRGWRRDVSLAVMLGTIITYAALANFSTSVLRATGMAILAMLARPLRGRYDLPTAASATALILMTVNPFHLFDSGFQLSFLAAYSIGVALPVVDLKIKELADRHKKEWITSAGNILCPCAVVQVGMAPLIAYHFLLFAPAGFLVNPPALLLAGLLLPIGLLMFLVSLTLGISAWLGPAGTLAADVLFSALTGIAEGLATLLLRLSALGQAVPGGGMCPAPPIGLLVMFYMIFFLFFSETRFILLRRGKHVCFRLLSSACLIAAVTFPFICGVSGSLLPWRYHTPLVTFLDVGQGDCIHIQDGNINILVDGGGSFYKDVGKTILEPYLLKNGITRIDLAFITHADLDHRKGIQELSQRMPVGKLVLSHPYIRKQDAFQDIRCEEVVYLSAGDSVDIGANLSFRILSPRKTVSNAVSENDLSLVMMLDYKDVMLLLTGDLERTAESQLSGPLPCDVLKVAHHGSAGSTGPEFLASTSPGFAVISCGKNNVHGHPAPRVIELLEKSGIILGRTDQCGALCLRSISPDHFLMENAARDLFWTVDRKDRE
ncbi:MAG TPA: DNA internalization-related competence protein ComEC/Rec2 [Clostridiales bacterium]|nr:DNA internalization-related competence protein ComEC/Rec2 [Clostridiales bacterium]